VILPDTNVLSELMRPRPPSEVTEWVTSQSASSLYVTAIAEAEILFGVQLLPAGKRRSRIESAAVEMFRTDFAGRVLSFGSDAALHYAHIAAQRRRVGRPISHQDAQIAAIARASGAAIATRNVEDFDRCGVRVLNPWR
jgi:hypothetical protein